MGTHSSYLHKCKPFNEVIVSKILLLKVGRPVHPRYCVLLLYMGYDGHAMYSFHLRVKYVKESEGGGREGVSRVGYQVMYYYIIHTSLLRT